MNYLDFLADVSIAGRVLQAGNGSTPEEFVQCLGADYGEALNRKAGFMRRDYGLLEVVFSKSADWVCTKIGIQVHRLKTGAEDVVPAALIHAVGPFPRSISFDALRERIYDKGSLVALADTSDPEYLIFRVGETSHSIHVVSGDTPDPDGLFPTRGEVWSIHVHS